MPPFACTGCRLTGRQCDAMLDTDVLPEQALREGMVWLRSGLLGFHFLQWGFYSVSRGISNSSGAKAGQRDHDTDPAGIGTGNQPTRASYTYVVDGIRYAKSTGWTGNGIFHLGKECDVRYNISKPSQSYLERTGQIINCVIGTIFALAGLGVLGCGLLLMQIL